MKTVALRPKKIQRPTYSTFGLSVNNEPYFSQFSHLQRSQQSSIRNAISPSFAEKGFSEKKFTTETSNPLSLLNNEGQQLSAEQQEYYGTRFNSDFSPVQIHTDKAANDSTQQLNAKAYTLGQHIVFGKNAYQPSSPNGRRLIAHELTHVLQQQKQSSPFLQRQPTDDEITDETQITSDPETELGTKLWSQFPAGVNVVFYDANDAETKRRGKDWAARENAIASTKTDFTAGDLGFGLAFPDDKFEVETTVPKLGGVLKAASDKAGKPDDIEPLKDTGPAQIRKLAVFAHGTDDWCGIGNGLTTGKASKIIGDIATYLTNDVSLILYACSVARGLSEDEDWRKGTMEDGGSDSLGATVRDALIDADKEYATVWGHTTVGHTSRNWALRVFKTWTGKGSDGSSFAGSEVFGILESILAEWDIEKEIQAKGYSIPEDKQTKFADKVAPKIEDAFYDCYREAHKHKDYNGVHLAEAAPAHPLEVATLISEYWDETFWPARRAEIADYMIKKLSLPETPEESSDESGESEVY